MHWGRRSRFSSTWLTIGLLLMGACMPTLAQALRSSAGGAWPDICTAAGPAVREVAGQEAAPGRSDEEALSMSAPCLYCSMQSAASGLPPAPLASVALPNLHHAAPAAFLAAPRTLFAWLAAQPRGPPAVA
jgi:hypothetical protein